MWTTQVAGNRNPGVATAAPTGKPSRSSPSRRARHAANNPGPAAR
ncbi:hypothetical protein FHR86_001613 [Paenarthrobacter ilicis]|uniref:Uncharacterized protein n=1 Tax=Paenarthrobacter ilicis TaxID=43665 RepID=A0ABX0TKT3_9MICC|nr:hypothetical protein [Paenarthrobacter ilicis]